jgi:hypothetical protein
MLALTAKPQVREMILFNIDENLTLIHNDSNGHSVPGTVPRSELVRLRRQRFNPDLILK